MIQKGVDLKLWNPLLTITDNANILKIKVKKAYYIASRHALDFVQKKRGIRTFIKKPLIQSVIKYPSLNFSSDFGMGEGAD